MAYHDRTSADHQAHFDDLFPKGYRITSLSVYGARGDERYAAVWIKRAGPDWSAVHGVDGAGYQAAFDNAVAAGLRPVLLAATGPANDPVFAGTFEQRPGPVPLTRFGLVRGGDTDPSTIDHWIAQARSNGWMPTSIAVYGSAPDLRYAGIWIDDPRGICWNMEGLADSAASYQSRFDALVPARARVVQAAVSPDDHYASIFRDDLIGEWVARHELSSSGYQQAFDEFVPQGFWPVSVQAGGVGAAARFAVVFGKTDEAFALTWQPPTGPAANAAIDDIMHQAMERHRIRGGAIALVRGGRLIYARGYTLAEPGYPPVQPTTSFRQASVSKTVVALAIHRLIQDGQLTLATPVQNVLSLTQPDGSPPAATFGQVTIQHLLEHTSGLPTNPYGVEPSVAESFSAAGTPTSLPVDGHMTDRYMITLPASAPPQPAQYSNWGYFLLGHGSHGGDRAAEPTCCARRPALGAPVDYRDPFGPHPRREPGRRRGAVSPNAVRHRTKRRGPRSATPRLGLRRLLQPRARRRLRGAVRIGRRHRAAARDARHQDIQSGAGSGHHREPVRARRS